MHELQVTESILAIALKHALMNGVEKILTIHLNIGELSELENEWLQKYFDYISKDTMAAGATLKIERTPVVMQCDSCAHSFQVDIKKSGDIQCPECGEREYTLTSGREYYIKDMEVM